MQEVRRIVGLPSLLLATGLLGLLTGGEGWASDHDSSAAPKSGRKPLDLRLTQAELRSIIRRYEARTGEILTAPVLDEEVEVTAPGPLAPMRDVSQDVWGGVAAPFWAIRHPTQAWRILVPIPPKGEPTEAEPPVPDPR
jgi:hypothetical protein